MERVKLLVSENGMVKDINGRYIFSAPMTERAKELTNNDGWKKGEESWLEYRNRTKKERITEEIKRNELMKDIVRAYNSYYNLN